MKNISKTICVFVCASYCAAANTKSAVQMQQLYKKIGSDLITIRKEYSAAQPMVYSLLDQVEKLYAVSKNVHQKKVQYKKLYKNKDFEVVSLKKDIAQMKSDFHATRSQLEVTHKKLEAEKANASLILKEKNDIINKISKLEVLAQQPGKKKLSKMEKLDEKMDLEAIEKLKESGLDLGQSLNLTSTSAPTSPR